ncbi:MAG: hypothetical protein AAFU64_07610, partial [Bacteroidota bacterium]
RAQCPITCNGGSTYLGLDAGINNKIGASNTFVGSSAGKSNTFGSGNSFFGHRAGFFNSEGSYNSAFGLNAGRNITVGNYNTYIGHAAGRHNGTGSHNAYLGVFAGINNFNGSYNVFLGNEAGANETGSHRLYISNSDTMHPLIYGEFDNKLVKINGDLEITGEILGLGIDLRNFTIDTLNTIIGPEAGQQNQGLDNLFVGAGAGKVNTSGQGNAFVGQRTGQKNTTGNFNVFMGTGAGNNSINGDDNTFLGVNASFANLSGSANTFVGQGAGLRNIGSGNTYIGKNAGRNAENLFGNVFIGQFAGQDAKGNNKLYISNNAASFPLIYGDFSNNFAAINGSLGVGIQNPERPIHLRATNAIFRIDRDRDDPGFAIVRYDNGFQNVWKSFYFYTRATGVNQGKFVIADWETNVAGPSLPRFVIDNQGDIGIGPRFENLGVNPSAKLHVDGTVRFENLPSREGQSLVIDNQGNLGIAPAASPKASSEIKQLKAEMDELKALVKAQNKEITELKALIKPDQDGDESLVSAQLFQNQPNPFDQSTEIAYFIPEGSSQAFIIITDLQGKEVRRYSLPEPGEGKLRIEAGSLGKGLYLYNLIVDQNLIASKRMFLDK